MSEPNTLPAVVGRRVRTVRLNAGYTQDELAATARRWGLDWTQGSVASLETGRRGLTADELLMLPFVLHVLDGGAHTLSSLLADAPDVIALPTGDPVDPWLLEGLLQGRPAAPAKRGREEAERDPLDFILEEMAGDSSPSVFREAERHAARVLGVTVQDVAKLAFRLWGHGLTVERDRRLGERVECAGDEDPSHHALRAHRGHVTRELLHELREVLEEGDENA